jgi:hypothetical protein
MARIKRSPQTRPRAASAAGRILRSPTVSKARSAAGSDLAQVGNARRTSAAAASAAARTLRSNSASKLAKRAAASDLAQRHR